MLGRSYEAMFTSRGEPIALKVTTDLTVPDYLFWKNRTLYEKVQHFEGPTGELRSSLMNLRRAAKASDVQSIIIGSNDFLHWRKVGKLESSIGTVVTKLDSMGKSMKAPQGVLDVYDAARMMMRLAR